MRTKTTKRAFKSINVSVEVGNCFNGCRNSSSTSENQSFFCNPGRLNAEFKTILEQKFLDLFEGIAGEIIDIKLKRC